MLSRVINELKVHAKVCAPETYCQGTLFELWGPTVHMGQLTAAGMGAQKTKHPLRAGLENPRDSNIKNL